MTVTPRQAELLKQTFARLEDDLRPHSLFFYDVMFRRAPEIRSMFRDDLDGQGMKFMTTLGRIIDDLPIDGGADGGATATHDMTLGMLAKTHARLGIKAQHFEPMEEALICTLQNALGADITPEVETAWRAAFGSVAERMITEGHIPAA